MDSMPLTDHFRSGDTRRSILIPFLCLITWVFAVAPRPSLAAEYYVDTQHPQASDSNPGTATLPWKTLYKPAQTLVAGDTVWVKAGTYDASTCPNYTIPSINPANSGTPGNPIAFRVVPGQQVFLDNKNKPGCPAIGSSGRNYIIIDGFAITNTGDQGIGLWGTSGTRLQGIIVENNIVSGMRKIGNTGDNTPGIYISWTTGTIIRNNTISDIDNGGTANAAAIHMYHNNDALIENNEIYSTNTGIFLKDDVQNTIVRYNFVHDCRLIGIAVWSHNGDTLKDNQVYGNIVARCDQGIMNKGSSANPNLNTVVRNNTVVNSRQPIDMNTGAQNGQAWNNILYGGTASGQLFLGNHLSYCDYNVYYSNPIECGANSLTTNPQFLSTAFQRPEDFKLQTSSPARAAGRNGEDIGAYPAGAETIGPRVGWTTPPLAPTGLTAR